MQDPQQNLLREIIELVFFSILTYYNISQIILQGGRRGGMSSTLPRWWPGLLLWVFKPGSQDLAGVAWVFAEEEIFNHGSNKCIVVGTQLKRLRMDVFSR